VAAFAASPVVRSLEAAAGCTGLQAANSAMSWSSTVAITGAGKLFDEGLQFAR
jgi:hypothetical protein